MSTIDLYAASSFLSVALNRVYRTAMAGGSRERPELAAAAIPLEIGVSPLPARGSDDLVRRMFEPLGWTVEVERIAGPNGPSRYVALALKGTMRLAEALSHLYVLIPVLDQDKHYWVGDDEVEKLIRKGEQWLSAHPERELIARRYLKHRRDLIRTALAQLEEKHMGSRAIVAICRDDGVARQRFGTLTDESGVIWTRTGRAFFADRTKTEAVLHRIRRAVDSAGVWEELATDWLLLDTEIMPWSAKASSLIEQQYEPVAVSANAGLSVALPAATRAAARGVAVGSLRDELAARLEKADLYATAWRPYAWPVSGVDDLRIAPFHVLASEGAVHFDQDHVWHMRIADRLADTGEVVLARTSLRQVLVSDATECADAAVWWEQLTRSGGEGMVVKPRSFVARGAKGLIQPALKVRGAEYLRIIYGPEYDLPQNLARLRQRRLGGKRALALREFALGHEALTRFVARAALRRVHECVFAVLALESEPTDPRL